MPIYEHISGREWQQEGLKKWDEILATEQQDFFVYACPGAGKTRFSLAAIKHAEELDAFDLVVVVCPTATLRRQWRDEANDLAKVRLDKFESPELKHASKETTLHTKGIVTTYAQVAKTAEAFAEFCKNMRVLVVFDEIHHCGDDKTWGVKIELAFGAAARRIILSGTPFRSDGRRIPFIMEHAGERDWRVRDPDAAYGYGKAAIEKVCRVITFHRMNAHIKMTDHNGSWTGDLDSGTFEERFRNKLYGAALDVEKCGFPAYMLKAGLARLKRIRDNEQSDAAMLVIARDQKQALQIQALLKDETGAEPKAVMSDVAASKFMIDAFKKSDEPVIVSVKMFAEGVDAPRIRVVVFMSREKTEMWFRQIVGRAVRYQNEPHIVGSQWAHMFIPKLPELEEMARRIEQDIEFLVQEGEGEPPPPPICRETGGPRCSSYPNCACGPQCELEERPRCGNYPNCACGPRCDLTGDPRCDTYPFCECGGQMAPEFEVSQERREGGIGVGHDVSEEEMSAGEKLVENNAVLERVGPEITALVIMAVKGDKALLDRLMGDLDATAAAAL